MGFSSGEVVSMNRAGMTIHYTADHRDGQGNLISRCVSLQPPPPPECLRFTCLVKYFRECLFFALLISYHRRRVTYAEANPRKKILERYRTGDPSPRTLWQTIHANIKLTCPVCRRYNVDPFLGGKKYGANSDGN